MPVIHPASTVISALQTMGGFIARQKKRCGKESPSSFPAHRRPLSPPLSSRRPIGPPHLARSAALSCSRARGRTKSPPHRVEFLCVEPLSHARCFDAIEPMEGTGDQMKLGLDAG